MARPWFRMYREMISSPKIQKLRPELFKAWVNVLCCTADDGMIPSIDDLAFMLRVNATKAKEFLSALVVARLVEERKGQFYAHDWDQHQYASDSSNERVKRYRNARSNGECNASVTPPDTDTDTDTEGQTRGALHARGPTTKKRSKLDIMLDPLRAEELANGVG